MTKAEAKQLRKGDRILYLARSCESVGTVINTGYVWFTVLWEKAYWGDHIYNYAINGDEKFIACMHKINVGVGHLVPHGLSSH